MAICHLFLGSRLNGQTNPPIVAIGTRELATNQNTVYFKDRSVLPIRPASFVGVGDSPPTATNFYALGWDDAGWEFQWALLHKS